MKSDLYNDFLRAKEMIKQNQYDEAIVIFREILEKDPNNYIVKFNLAKLLKDKLEYLEEAKALFTEVSQCKESKNRYLAVFDLGKIEYRQRNYKGAKKYFESLLETESRIHALLEVAKCEIKLGNFDAAREHFKELLLFNNPKKMPVILAEYGRFELELHHYDEAEKILSKLYEYDNKEFIATADFEIAKIAMEKGEYEKARNLLIPLLNRMNKFYVITQLGKIEKMQGNKEKAKEYYSQLLNGNRKARGVGLLELGMIEYNDNNFEEATKYFEELKDIDFVSRTQALLNLGRIKTREGRYFEAKEDLLELANMDEKSKSYAYLELGRLEMYNGNYEEAIEYFNKVNRRESGAFVDLELARIDLFKDDFASAKERYEKLLNLDNRTQAFAYHGLINIALREQDYETALYYANEVAKTGVFASEQNQRVIDYACFKLGLTKDAGFIGPYYFSLLNNYSKDTVIKHMMDRLDENDECLGNAKFIDSVNYYDLYDIAEEQIKDKAGLKAMLADIYIVPLEEEIGSVGDKKTTAIRVATFPGSKDIVAIYPYPDDLCKIKKDLIK